MRRKGKKKEIFFFFERKGTPKRGVKKKMTSEDNSDDLLTNWAPEMPTVQEINKNMQNFAIPDYTVFVLMLLVSAFVGIYFGFVKKISGEDEYLVGGRNMKTFPISLSLIASFISGQNVGMNFFSLSILIYTISMY